MPVNGPSAAPPVSSTPRGKHLYDLPNEILLKILAALPCVALLPLGLTSTRLHDLARRALRGHLVSTVCRTDLRIILESYHPWAQWTEPYLYCTYLDTPGLGLDGALPLSSPPLSGRGSPLYEIPPPSPPLPLELVCPDANAPPLCSESSLAALLHNVYSRFLPLVPGAMTVTETRHPAGGRMPVRKGNITRAASSSATTTPPTAASSSLSSSAPTSSSSFPSSTIDPTGVNVAALRNAALLTDRLRTTNPTVGPDNHEFTNGVMVRQQIDAESSRAAILRRTTSDDGAASPAAEEETPLVSHRIRMDADEPFSQLVVQTSLVSAGPRPGVFGRLLPVNNQGVVRVKREWLEQRAAAAARDDAAERVRRTLWVDHGRDVGLRVRVQKLDPADDDRGDHDDDHQIGFDVRYEELLIRTAHLHAVIDRAERGEVAGRANRGIVFGTLLERGWVRG